MEVFVETNWQQMTTSDDFSNFLSQLMTFHNHVTTFLTTCEDLWTTLPTLGNDLLMTLMKIMKTCWWPWPQLVTTLLQHTMTKLMTLVMTLTYDELNKNKTLWCVDQEKTYLNIKDCMGVPCAFVEVKGFWGSYTSLKSCLGILRTVFFTQCLMTWYLSCSSHD